MKAGELTRATPAVASPRSASTPRESMNVHRPQIQPESSARLLKHPPALLLQQTDPLRHDPPFYVQSGLGTAIHDLRNSQHGLMKGQAPYHGEGTRAGWVQGAVRTTENQGGGVRNVE
jgi:hypothetical protein